MQISLRKNHWRNPESHSNKFLSVTFLNRVPFELDSELDAAKEFRECRRMGKNCFPRLLLGSKRKGKLVPVRVSVLGWLFDFVSRLHDDWVISYLAIWGYSVWFKIANITHALPVPVDRQTDFHTETFGRFAFTLYRCEISYRSEILFPVQQPGWAHAGWLAPAWRFVVVSCKQM